MHRLPQPAVDISWFTLVGAVVGAAYRAIKEVIYLAVILFGLVMGA
jgi:hypothetical protein